MLNDSQKQRYARQLVLREWGEEVQEKLLKARALIVGAGGLGSPVALYMAAAGIGNIDIADGDAVELSNLNRQILHATCDVGRPKVQSAKEKIEALNPDCRVQALSIRMTPENTLELFEAADIILDCSDSFPSKYLLNDAAVLSKRAMVHAGVLAFGGQVMTVTPESACLRCLFPDPPPQGAMPSPSEAGILGAVAASIGVIQATEAIKYIAGIGSTLKDRLLTYDALEMRWLEVKVRRNPECPVCGKNPTIKKLAETLQPCGREE